MPDLPEQRGAILLRADAVTVEAMRVLSTWRWTPGTGWWSPGSTARASRHC
jgi:hypothetical protein